MLDYIIYSTDSGYLQPLKVPTLEIVKLKAPEELSYAWDSCRADYCFGHLAPFMAEPIESITGAEVQRSTMTGRDLSDHYPVVAIFTFKPWKKSFPVLDGCKKNDDCEFIFPYFYCYCEGEGCTSAGRHISGWDAGQANPVNANCHMNALSTAATCFCRPGDS